MTTHRGLKSAITQYLGYLGEVRAQIVDANSEAAKKLQGRIDATLALNAEAQAANLTPEEIHSLATALQEIKSR